MAKDITNLVDELVLDVTPAMQQAKAAYWAVAGDLPTIDPADITLAAAQQICPDTRLKRWWNIPGFVEWFTNRNEWRQRVEYLVNRGLDAIEDVLNDPEAAPSARVKAFEVLARLSEKEPARVKEVRFKDSFINNMSLEEAKAYVEKHQAKLGEASDDSEEKPE